MTASGISAASFAGQLSALPFVIKRPGGCGFDFWAPRPTGAYADDVALGAAYAEAAMPLLHSSGHLLLTWIMLGMVERGEPARDRGVIVGFGDRAGSALRHCARSAFDFGGRHDV